VAIGGTAASTSRLRVSGIVKAFGAVEVLHGIDFDVQPGEIHGLVGQNGAGKSTLVRILAGAYSDYGGSIAIDGRSVEVRSPRDAISRGIAVIYQEFSLVPQMTVAENLALGVEPGGLTYASKSVRRVASAWLAEVGMLDELRLDDVVGGLSAAMRQRVEIAKALSRHAAVVVLDEPTSRLAGPDRERLFALMRQIASSGTSLIFISHFLEEVLAVCDRITVLRDGVVVASDRVSAFDKVSLGSLMMGGALAGEIKPLRDLPADGGEALLRAVDLSCGQRVRDVSLTVHSGEIVGLAGLVGSGRSTVGRALVGATRLVNGTIEVRGSPVRFRSPRDARRAGVVLLPEDRRSQGLVGVRSATDNVTMLALAGSYGIVWPRELSRIGNEAMARFEVRPPDGQRRAETFSGGNQQKLLLARAVLARPLVLIVDQPTAGVDVGTTVQIHRILREEAERGAGVLVISDDIDEIVTTCDRALIMQRGRLVAERAGEDLTREALLNAL